MGERADSSSGALLPRAAAVARPDGSVALVSGAPRAGTSTLVATLAALTDPGVAYLADETTVLDPGTLEVRPLREPLVLHPGSPMRLDAWRPPGAMDDDDWLVEATTFAATAVPDEPLEVRLLVMPQYDAETAGVRTIRMSGGEAAHLLGSRCTRLAEVEGGPLPALARLARRVPAYHLRYADHRLAAEEVTRLWRLT